MELIPWIVFAIIAVLIESLSGKSKKRPPPARRSPERSQTGYDEEAWTVLREQYGLEPVRESDESGLTYEGAWQEEAYEAPSHVEVADVEEVTVPDYLDVRDDTPLRPQVAPSRSNRVKLNRSRRRVRLNPATVREGIVLMEILGKPKGMSI